MQFQKLRAWPRIGSGRDATGNMYLRIREDGADGTLVYNGEFSVPSGLDAYEKECLLL